MTSDEVLTQFGAELQSDATTAPLAALIPTDGRKLELWSLAPLLPLVMNQLQTADDVVRVLDASVRGYVRARGLHNILED